MTALAEPLPETGTMLDDRPGREIRFGLIVAGLFFVVLLGWAAFAPLDSAAFAPGRLAVSGQRQAVQHREGGVVARILVREGQRVRQGELLVELAAADVRAQERALGGQVISLKAERARLLAEQAGQAAVRWPVEFAALTGEDRSEADAAVARQQAQFAARASVLIAQTGAMRQQIAQSLQGATGFRKQAEASRQQARLVTEELDAIKGVADKGYVAKTRLRALERARAELLGQEGQYAANTAQATTQAGEARIKLLEIERAFREKSSAELRNVELSLADLEPRFRAARDQLERVRIRAPASGTVVGLSVFTPGGVIAPGQKLMDVVPQNAALVIEARVAPGDADDVQAGQGAEIRFTGLHDRQLPILSGKVTRLSADSFEDERTGEPYFLAEVAVPASELEAIRRVRGADFRLRAGMPVEVLVPLRKRTALQYIFEPLSQTMWRLFREH
ncbi:HlyD family type I secretion periplasmic adaptor subunit [Sphingomonas sp. BT-65]|uniref:HlyD family type I secretion periplasmic adaptor subunit n=1 Tax=Sphingomonas sp. BT-65 TaxID=2989821 RepID=UPI0022365011|nr:HlyD family type I secretion periplasmic adaptor subunit [Sphingomonas sp. BT-65]MCW4463593.1 HlyD family type I secretion periplasmic adaptor subunit [Sphingomonas sp. BT-65]